MNENLTLSYELRSASVLSFEEWITLVTVNTEQP